MGRFLLTLAALALGAAAGALAVALQPQWGAEITRLAAPVIAKLQPSAEPQTYPNAVAIKDSADGGFDHFLGPFGSIRTSAKGVEYFMDSVPVRIVIDEAGNVVQALSRSPEVPAEFAAEATAIARRWKFIPFERNGRPVVAQIDTSVGFSPPERRQDYRQPFPEIKDRHTLRIALERTGCFGTCPSYSVKIDGDGKVTYRGGSFVAIQGEHHATLAPRVIDDLLARFRSADFFSLLDGYHAQITDNPAYTVSIAFDGRTKAVYDYVGLMDGMPDAVRDLEDAIDRAVNIERWTRGNAETVPSLHAEGWDFKSSKPENLSIAAGIAQYGTIGVLKDLIASGAPLTATVEAGYWRGHGRQTALELAAQRGDAAMVSALLEAPNTKWPKLVLSSAAARGAATGVSEIVSWLIMAGADSKFKDDTGHTLLMSAAESGVPNVIDVVLNFESGAWDFDRHPTMLPGTITPNDKNTDVNAQDNEGATALMLNSSALGPGTERPDYNRGKCAALLIAVGARVDMKDKKGNTALILNGIYPDVATALIKAGANVNAQNAEGETALMHALTREMVEVLLKAGADPYIHNAQGKTALEVLELFGYSKDAVAFLKVWIAAHPKPK